MGFGASSSSEPRASRISQAGDFVKSFLGAAKEMAISLKLYGATRDSAATLMETMQEVPECMRSWKESSACHGARMAFSVIKSSYKDVDIAMCSKGLTKVNNYDEENNATAI